MSVAMPQFAESDETRLAPAFMASELRRLRLLLRRFVLSLRDRSDSEATATISADIAAAEAERARLRDALASSDRVAPLDLLAGTFGLHAVEREAVVLALAVELDPSLEPLIAQANENTSRTRPTPALALALSDTADGASALALFGEGGPLRQFRIMEHDPSDPSPLALRPLRLADRVISYLLGMNTADTRVADLLRSFAPSVHADAALVARAEQWLTAQGGRFPQLVVNLIGLPGSGRSSLARAIADRFGVTMLRLSARRLLAAPDRDDLLHILARDAALQQAGFYVDLSDTDAADPLTSQLGELIDRLYGFVIVAGRSRWPGERQTLVLDVARPDRQTQAGLWRRLLPPDSSSDEAIDAVVQQFDFGPGAIAQTAWSMANGELDLWSACRARAGATISELAQRLTPAAAFDDIVLPADAMALLREIVGQVAHRSVVYEQWGFGAKLTRGRGISALFSGASGTGKTMAAEVLANALRLDLYRIDLSAVVSKYIGETEKNLRRVFDAAEESGAVLFIDEADALFGKRTEIKDSHDRYANVEVSYLLQRMEQYRGLAILATNLKSHIDQAFLRRLRFIVSFPMPGPAERLEIWRRAFPSAAATEDLDFEALARLDIAGGNIRNISVNASFLAAAEGSRVRMAYVMRAAGREYQKIERIITPAEFGPYYAMAVAR
jgi:ATP-dependent 26S proteasome regulatory subunit